MLTIPEIEAACRNSQPIPEADAVYARVKLPLSIRLYPLGFPMDLCTNSAEVLEAATESWGAMRCLVETKPIQVRVCVLEGTSTGCPPTPVCRVQQHLFCFVADSENYGVSDMERGLSSLWLTQETLKHRRYLRFFFLECGAICLIATRLATGVHAACVSRNGVGVLLCGDSGAGKTTLSYACAKAGWTYVTDDGSFVVHGREDLLVTGNSSQVRFRPESKTLFPEIDGRDPLQRGEKGKPSIEINDADLGGITRAQSATVQYLVFLNRREGENMPLRRYSKQVVREFLRQGRFSPPEMLPLHYATIDRILEAEVLELRYRDLDWAIEQLETLVETEKP